jgi:hypothetical protein
MQLGDILQNTKQITVIWNTINASLPNYGFNFWIIFEKQLCIIFVCPSYLFHKQKYKKRCFTPNSIY